MSTVPRTKPDKALTANAFAVRVLARAAQEVGATLVHYSTDFVFDGKTTRPYTEDDAPNPQSVYAQSKLLGEWFALEAPRAFVLRVESLFGGSECQELDRSHCPGHSRRAGGEGLSRSSRVTELRRGRRRCDEGACGAG